MWKVITGGVDHLPLAVVKVGRTNACILGKDGQTKLKSMVSFQLQTGCEMFGSSDGIVITVTRHLLID